MLLIGNEVDERYRIEKIVYSTRTHSTYHAFDEVENKEVVLHEYLFDGVNNTLNQDIIDYYYMLHKLKHPSIPKIIDCKEINNGYLFIVESFDGKSLSKIVDDIGAQNENDVVKWGKQLCDVLGYLHSNQIIYRDMQPVNVMLKSSDDLVLIDLGAAITEKKLSYSIKSGKMFFSGTPGYAAPEQYGRGNLIDARSDIFSLGATLYHLVTGHHPAEPPYEMHPIRHWNPELSERLECIILKCTRISPEDRYQSCAELLYDLEHMEAIETYNPNSNPIMKIYRRIKGLF